MLHSSFDLSDTKTVVEVEDLKIGFRQRGEGLIKYAVNGVSLVLETGKIIALIGESGSGKSVTARALVGLNGGKAVTTAKRMNIQGRSSLRFSEHDWKALRGREIGFVLQDALTSLDPLRSLEKEVLEPLVVHRWGDRMQRQERVLQTLNLAGLPDAAVLLPRRPDEMSGGQRQRALIAQATVLSPSILIADEPTTALDSTVQAQILSLLETLKERGHAILLITHDLGVVSRLADQIHVMKDGRIIETGTSEQILRDPKTSYTRALIEAVPNPDHKRNRLSRLLSCADYAEHSMSALAFDVAKRDPGPAVEVKGVSKTYFSTDGNKVVGLRDISFSAATGQTLGIVGESGSGKSSLSWIIAGLKSFDTGSVRVFGRSWDDRKGKAAFELRRSVQIVYQDPLSSFDPRHTVGQVLIDALIPDRKISPAERAVRAEQVLRNVHLATDLWYRNPLTLSGGQRQRLSIARALITGAKMLVLDEPVSALDATIQAQILDLFKDLQEQLGLTYIFVSHDLGVVHHMSDSILVMKAGEIVERGSSERIFFNPQTNYAQALVAAVPRFPSFINNTL